MLRLPISNEKCWFDPNQTNIIFDDKLKIFINNTRTHMNERFPINDVNNSNYKHLEEKQDYLKEYVKNHKNDLSLIENKFHKSMKPDMFAINVCLLTDITPYSSWDEIEVQDIISSAYFKVSNRDGLDRKKIGLGVWDEAEYDSELEKKYNCCCGRRNIVAKNTYLSCPETKMYSCLFGGCCFTKMTITLNDSKLNMQRKNAIKKEKEKQERQERQERRKIEEERRWIEEERRLMEEEERRQIAEERRQIVEETRQIVEETRQIVEEERQRIEIENKNLISDKKNKKIEVINENKSYDIKFTSSDFTIIDGEYGILLKWVGQKKKNINLEHI